jgi:hypothetical protein
LISSSKRWCYDEKISDWLIKWANQHQLNPKFRLAGQDQSQFLVQSKTQLEKKVFIKNFSCIKMLSQSHNHVFSHYPCEMTQYSTNELSPDQGPISVKLQEQTSSQEPPKVVKNVDYYMKLPIIVRAKLGGSEIEDMRNALRYYVENQIPEDEIFDFILVWFED